MPGEPKLPLSRPTGPVPPVAVTTRQGDVVIMVPPLGAASDNDEEEEEEITDDVFSPPPGDTQSPKDPSGMLNIVTLFMLKDLMWYMLQGCF